MLLLRDAVHKPEDDTLPDLERMERRLGEKSTRFLSQVYDDDYNPEAPAKKVPAREKAPAKEKPSSSEAIDMEDAVRTGAVNKLTVETLKNWLKSKKISVTKLKKAELIDLVKEHI